MGSFFLSNSQRKQTRLVGVCKNCLHSCSSQRYLFNIIVEMINLLKSWPSGQTLFATHFRFACQAMFLRLAIRQSIFRQPEASRNCCLKCYETLTQHSVCHRQRILTKQILVTGSERKWFLGQANGKCLTNNV